MYFRNATGAGDMVEKLTDWGKKKGSLYKLPQSHENN